MNEGKKLKILKNILIVAVAVFIIGTIIYLFPLILGLATPDGQAKFQEEIGESGIYGILLLFAIQVVQIFLIILPGEPIEILAGMYYGEIGGTIFIIVSSCIISTVIFFLVRKFGRRFVLSFCNKEKVEKIEKSKIFQNPKKIEFIMLMLFLMPGTPKDLLVYVAGLLPIKPIRFIIISTIARFPSVITSTLIGSSIVDGRWKISIIMNLIIFILVGVIVFVINKFDKNKLTEEAMSTIK